MLVGTSLNHFLNTHAFVHPTLVSNHLFNIHSDGSDESYHYMSRCSSLYMNADSADVIPTTKTIVDENSPNSKPATSHYYHHHVAIKTRNIENAILFYSLFGFEVECKFRAGPARAAWLTTTPPTSSTTSPSIPTRNTRLELIEVPAYLLQEEEGTRQRAIDLMTQETLLGLNHVALDVTGFVHCLNQTKNTNDDDNSHHPYFENIPPRNGIVYALDGYLDYLNALSQERFGKTMRVALQPQQQRIGNNVYELAFLYDADGSLLELLYHVSEIELDDLNNDMVSGWVPWDGKGFKGQSFGIE